MQSQSSKKTANNALLRILWKEPEVFTLREKFKSRIIQESEKWKDEKARKDSEENAAITTNDTGSTSRESDDEVIVQVTSPILSTVKRGKDSNSETQGHLQAAARLRG